QLQYAPELDAVLGLAQLEQPLPIASGTEAAARPGHNHSPHGLVLAHGLNRLQQLLAHGAGQSVELLWTLQCDRDDGDLGLDLDQIASSGRRPLHGRVAVGYRSLLTRRPFAWKSNE